MTSNQVLLNFQLRELNGISLVEANEWKAIEAKFKLVNNDTPFLISSDGDYYLTGNNEQPTVGEIKKSILASSDPTKINAFRMVSPSKNVVGIDIMHEISEFLAVELSERDDSAYTTGNNRFEGCVTEVNPYALSSNKTKNIV
jgi:hypothetical protein